MVTEKTDGKTGLHIKQTDWQLTVISNLAEFCAIIKAERVFAEEAMDELEEALILPSNYVKTDLEILAETSGSANVSRLYLSRSAKRIKILK